MSEKYTRMIPVWRCPNCGTQILFPKGILESNPPLCCSGHEEIEMEQKLWEVKM